MKTRLSLRKKIILLAILPVAAACLIFALMLWISERRADAIVRNGVTNFMVQRTERSLVHAYNSSNVTIAYVTGLLRAQTGMAEAVLTARGGVAASGPAAPWALVGDANHVGGPASLPGLRVGAETLGSTGRSAVLNEIAGHTGGTVVLFNRVPHTGEWVRVASNVPAVKLGTFLSATEQATGQALPADALLNGKDYLVRTEEAGTWHLGHYEPLRDGSGQAIAALYIGMPIDQIQSFRDELTGNAVGAHGSVSLLYAHAGENSKLLDEPEYLAATTEAQWLPRVRARALTMRDGEEVGFNLHDDAEKADAIVRFTYLQHFDWVVVTVADSRDLQAESLNVNRAFTALIWESLLVGLLVLLTVGAIAAVIGRRTVDPLMDITIQLTSNGTQVASSAAQHMSNATSFNVSSTEIATAVKEISSTSQELLRAMKELWQEATQASAVAKEGSNGLRALSRSIETLSTATHTITDALTQIRNRAGKITTVTSAVTKVADQTNLLSLNAAIEAEKAGSAGAGFGVVAREIRRLADQSAMSSQEIEGAIAEMVQAVTSGVEEVHALATAMEASVLASERINEQFTEIISRVEAMTPRYEIVHHGMQNQSEGAQQISDAMWQLTESAGQTSESTAEMMNVSRELHEAVRVLKQRVFEEEVHTPAPFEAKRT